MSRFSIVAIAATVLFAAPHLANATVFSGRAAFTDTSTGNTLQVNATPNPASFTTPDLAVGQTYYDAGLITLTTSGNYASLFGATQSDKISLAFTFTSPSPAAGAVTQAGTVSQTEFLLSPRFDNGSVDWQNDNYSDANGTFARQLVTFGDGSQINLDIYDTDLNGTTTARAGQIDIRISNVRAAVPEPASMAVLGAGLAGLGMVRRRRNPAAAC